MGRFFVLKPPPEEHESFLSSSSTLAALLFFIFANAFANVLMRCAVTMVSNVSDCSDAERGVLLHAHMSEQKCHMEWAKRRFPPGCGPMHACTHADRCQHQREGVCICAPLYQE